MLDYNIVKISIEEYCQNDPILFSIIKNNEDVKMIDYVQIRILANWFVNLGDLQLQSEESGDLVPLEDFKEKLLSSSGNDYTSHEIRTQDYHAFAEQMNKLEDYFSEINKFLTENNINPKDYNKTYFELTSGN